MAKTRDRRVDLLRLGELKEFDPDSKRLENDEARIRDSYRMSRTAQESVTSCRTKRRSLAFMPGLPAASAPLDVSPIAMASSGETPPSLFRLASKMSGCDLLSSQSTESYALPELCATLASLKRSRQIEAALKFLSANAKFDAAILDVDLDREDGAARGGCANRARSSLRLR